MATTVPGQIQTQQINGRTYYLDNGQWVDASGRAAPNSNSGPDTSGSDYEQGVTATDPITGYVSNYNPGQFATADAANRLGDQLGLPVSEQPWDYNTPSAPVRNLGGGLNAGLVNQELSRPEYGSGPGSYGQYLIDRDQRLLAGQAPVEYGQYYSSPATQSAIQQQSATRTPASTAAPFTGTINPTPTGRGSGVTPSSPVSLPSWAHPTPASTQVNTTPQAPANPGTTAPPAPAPTADRTIQPYVRQPVQGPPIPGGNSGSAPAPNGAYAPRSTPATFSSRDPNNPYPSVKPMYTQQDTPEGENKGEGLQYKTENDRALAIQRGEELNNDLANYTNQQYGEAGDFSDLQGAAYQGIASGQGGYSGDEKNAILREDELDSLQQTPEEAQQNYLTSDEQNAILGDTERGIRQLGTDEAGIDAAGNTSDANVRGELYQYRDRTNDALNAQDTNVRNAVSGQKAYTRGVVSGEAANARKYLDPNALNTSAEYNSAYNFGDRDSQDIQDKAARSIQAQSQADEDRLLSDANANGNTSPLAIQAARDRIRLTSGANSADALTDARIQAKLLQLQTAQNKENTRLEAAQNYANLGTNTELNLGQDALENEQSLGAAEIGAESYLGDQRTKTQQALGTTSIGVEKGIGDQKVDIATKGTDRNLAAYQAADAANSTRAGQVATNRQATSEGNQNTQYTRGKSAYDAKSAANTNFANQRRADEQEYRKTLADRQAQAAQNTQVGNQQRIGNYGAETGATNAATGNAIVNYKVPSTTEKVLGGIASVVAGAKGLVSPGPQDALVAEKGPELEVNLAKLPRYQYGFDPTEEMDPYGTGYVTGSGETETEGSGLPGGTSSQNRENPFWKKLVNGIVPSKYGYEPFKAQQVDDAPYQSPIGKKKGGGGGLIGKMLTAGAFGDGGIVQPSAQPVAPGVKYLQGPQIRTLGTDGPTAIVPLTRRPGNKINVEDIPRLAQEYGNYGRPNYA